MGHRQNLGSGFFPPANLRIAALLEKFQLLSNLGPNHIHDLGSRFSTIWSYQIYPWLTRAIPGYPQTSPELTKERIAEQLSFFAWLDYPNYANVFSTIK